MKKIMWAILHVPSGRWDNGDAQLVLYPFEHEARIECKHEAFKPIKVTVSDEK